MIPNFSFDIYREILYGVYIEAESFNITGTQENMMSRTPAQERFVEWYSKAQDQNRTMGEGYYTVEEFKVEPLNTSKCIMVSRTYAVTRLQNVRYSDCYIVGPRGAIRKTVYKHIGY